MKYYACKAHEEASEILDKKIDEVSIDHILELIQKAVKNGEFSCFISTISDLEILKLKKYGYSINKSYEHIKYVIRWDNVTNPNAHKVPKRN